VERTEEFADAFERAIAWQARGYSLQARSRTDHVIDNSHAVREKTLAFESQCICIALGKT